MNRWWGSSNDSDKQAAERNARAARRTIAALPTVNSDSDDEYGDCETSLLFGVDGADDASLDNAEMAEAAAELARQRALPFEDADFDNDPDFWKKELKLKFNQEVEYWFNSVEAQMTSYGINKQWDKKNSILPMLPEDLIEELMPLLRLKQAEAGMIYKAVKTEILQLYGPKDEDAFSKAIALRLTDRPSALAKKLIHILCPGTTPFQGCHCAKIVYGFWHAQRN